MSHAPESLAKLTAAERALILARGIQDRYVVLNSDGTIRASARAVLKYGDLRDPRGTLKALFYILKDRLKRGRS